MYRHCKSTKNPTPQFYLLYMCFSFCQPFLTPIPPFSITFGLSIGLTAVALLVERNEGLLDRSWVAGVNVAELLISQVMTQFIIIIVQIALLVSITIWAFKVHVDTHRQRTKLWQWCIKES